jgi:cytochrome bd-type quinol oxidase subunit 1
MSDIFAARSQMAISLLIGGSATVCGDALAGVMARKRSTKLAAMAGDFQTRSGAPLRIGGLPDMQTKNYKIARMAAMLQVGIFCGAGDWQFPFLLQGDFTVSEAAAAPPVLWSLIGATAAGLLVLFPSIWYLMQIFKANHDDISLHEETLP